MARRRSRLLQSRRERAADRSGPDPAASMRLAGFVAMVLVVIAVAAGFQGDRFAAAVARWLSALGPLAEPVIFGASWLEIGAGLAVLAFIAVMAVRQLRR